MGIQRYGAYAKPTARIVSGLSEAATGIEESIAIAERQGDEDLRGNMADLLERVRPVLKTFRAILALAEQVSGDEGKAADKPRPPGRRRRARPDEQ